MIRYISEQTGPNAWNVYKVDADNTETPPILVATTTDYETLCVLLQAPATKIMQDVQKRLDKKHYLEKKLASLDSFQSSMYKYLKKL